MGDDLLVFGQFGEPVFELGERQRKRPLDMTSAVFLRRAHAQHHDLAVAHSSQQLLLVDGLQRLPLGKEIGGDLVDLRQSPLPQKLQHAIEIAHRDVG